MKYLIALALFVAAAAPVRWDKLTPIEVDCGLPLPFSKNLLITNGNIAKAKQFPYQVGILITAVKWISWCGGTLISDRWIITAAHCVDQATSLNVYLGALNRTNPKEPGQKVIHVGKENIIIHEDWNRVLVQNDISLIKLPTSVTLNKYIQPAKLPKNSKINYAGSSVVISGWGKVSDSARMIPEVLHWVKVPVTTNSVCSQSHIQDIKNSQVCINTKGGKSACHGDSGGPVILADGSNTLIGAFSYGSYFCEVGETVVCTRIAYYLDWIAKHTGIRHISIERTYM